jgi:type II secretory pathway predicted ATPase ExeA
LPGLYLKYVLGGCRISQGELARSITKPSGGTYSRTLMSHVCMGRWQWFPKTDPGFKKKVEKFLAGREDVRQYLAQQGKALSDIWNEVKNGKPVRMGGPTQAYLKKLKAAKEAHVAAASAEAREIEITVEVEMLTFEAKKAFKVFRDPFQHEVQGTQDIFMSEESRYMFYAMKDAALNGGFMAIVGEVGSGKSIARKWLEEELRRDEMTQVIYSCALDKGRLTDASLLDAIIMDLSREAPKPGPEKRARQVRRLLIDRSRDGYKIVLLVEEAQDLTLKAFKVLKRLYEVEDGFKKTLGIVLIGQPELGQLLSERDHPEMREVIRRCQVAEIRGLNGGIRDYLDHKFKRASLDRAKIIDDAAIEALAARLTAKDRRERAVSYAYPLTVNNLITRAMNLAADMGEERVTADVINTL